MAQVAEVTSTESDQIEDVDTSESTRERPRLPSHFCEDGNAEGHEADWKVRLEAISGQGDVIAAHLSRLEQENASLKQDQEGLLHAAKKGGGAQGICYEAEPASSQI